MAEEQKTDHKLILAHDKLLKDHEKRLGHVEKEILQMHQEFLQGLDRVDQSSKYLREQNNDILGAIIKRNETEEQQIGIRPSIKISLTYMPGGVPRLRLVRLCNFN